jgi:hypothetical protein
LPASTPYRSSPAIWGHPNLLGAWRRKYGNLYSEDRDEDAVVA